MYAYIYTFSIRMWADGGDNKLNIIYLLINIESENVLPVNL